MTPIRNEAAKAGRDPDQMFLCNLMTPVSGATKSEAEDKMALIEKLPLEIDALSLLAEGLNYDFASKGIDEPLTTEELQGMQGMLGIRDGVLQDQRQDQSERARFRHLLRPRPDPGRDRRRAEGNRRQAGRDVRRAAAATALWSRRPIVPGSYADFVSHVVPELQRRGLFHKDYAGKTLARKSRADAPGRRRMENPAAGRGGIKKEKCMRWLKFTADGTDLLGHRRRRPRDRGQRRSLRRMAAHARSRMRWRT